MSGARGEAKVTAWTRRDGTLGLAGREIGVASLTPPRPRGRPVIMLHGGGHTGECYLRTPDGRPGWAELFAAAGRSVHVVDWPGRGRAPRLDDFADLSAHEVVASLASLARAVGPAVVLAHSAGGPMAWRLAELCPGEVAGVVAVAPGPPANLTPVLPDDPAFIATLRFDEAAGCPVYSPPGAPVAFDRAFIAAYWANSPRFPHAALDAYAATIVAESPRLMNERFNIGGSGLAVADPAVVAARPILVVTGERDLRHPREVDARTASFFGAEFVWLPERGVRDNGHMLMIEDNSDEIAGLVLDWLSDKGL